MKFLHQFNTGKIILVSFISAVFISYPNISFLPWELSYMDEAAKLKHIIFFVFRYLFFSLLAFILLKVNLRKVDSLNFSKRLLFNSLICGIAYGIYALISLSTCTKADCFGSILLFQFVVACILFSLFGHVYQLYAVQRKKEQEIEQLKIENLQSRCDALANQINPHFFFNSLNSLTALIRKKDDEITLAFVSKLSDVFRYILQSEKKSLVSLGEELKFVEAFRYMLEIRFANKLLFNIRVPEDKRHLKLPALSLLPLVDNIVVHNVIDSENKMQIEIELNENDELLISNPIFPKITAPVTNGTGLKNLENRFHLLMNKQIRILQSEKLFTVILPLKP
ncbi:sensor histidine kinase [Mangrovibacterium marinum]|uniref:Histidine kinase n=1 Tax=Mangrovibacterium marinum TaxID=1639118 RepID=A0A2T5C0T0_9BACT|nr:histidine kinase [Mangrovibacterium marinum]PTN08216.1 histidine kinase [Mangrovibacterium marinum]